MQVNYYYLVSGLPEISRQSDKLPVSFNELAYILAEQVHEKDRELVTFIQFRHDNDNLLYYLNDPDTYEKRFDRRAFFSPTELITEIKYPDLLPDYLKSFLEAYHSKALPFAHKTLEDNIAWYYFQSAATKDNDFIRKWFTFEGNLRNVLAGFNIRKLKDLKLTGDNFTPENFLLPLNDIVTALLKSAAPDFGLAAEYDWITPLAEYQTKLSDLTGYESLIDKIKWQMLDELTLMSYFTIDTILAYLLKLEILERWANLDEEKGKERFEAIVNSFVSRQDLTTPQ